MSMYYEKLIEKQVGLKLKSSGKVLVRSQGSVVYAII